MRSRSNSPALHYVFLSACALLLGATAARAQAGGSGTEHPDSRTEIYAGYGYFHPINSGIDGFQYQDVYNPNATVSLSGFFNRYVGLQLEGGYFSGTNQHKAFFPECSKTDCDQLVYTAQAGPVLRLPLGSWVPFAHFLGGGSRYNGPVMQPLKWGWGVTGGFGIDYVVPGFNNHLALRPIQADFQYSQNVYGPLVLPAGTEGGFGEIDAIKLSAGIVARFGDYKAPHAVELGCSAQPTLVHPGEPLLVTGSTLYLNPAVKPIWHWETSGGVAKPDEGNVSIDTTGLAPGEYTVVGHVIDGRRARNQASCTVPFEVKAFDPPAITCVASPASVISGTEVQIVSSGNSPQNRPLTYSYSASAGVLTPTGPLARLATAGLGNTTIDITCNVVDDLGQKATFATQVAVTKPVEPVIPQVQELCSLGFTRDQKRPVRVDNEAKGCLDDIALTMTLQTDSRLVMVGNASPDEKPEAAAQRVLNARQYLTDEKGIERSRIDVRVGETSGRSVRDVLVPSGASFSEPATQPFEEKTITRRGEAYGKRRLRHPHIAQPATVQSTPTQPGAQAQPAKPAAAPTPGKPHP